MPNKTPPASDLTRFAELLEAIASEPGKLVALRHAAQELNAQYRPWRKAQFLARDRRLDPAQVWIFAKGLQYTLIRELPELRQIDGAPFFLCQTALLHEALHRIDRGLGGGGPAALDPERGDLGDEAMKTRIRVKTWMDEAAESSIIEGASVTRKVAVDMLRSDRAPGSTGELMIANNYAALQRVKEWRSRPLAPDMLLELQSLLTTGTLEHPDQAGRYRRDDEDIRVVDTRTNDTAFTPPVASSIPARVKALCDFANREHTGPEFIHPVVKASILHFMVGYIHPFCDGNGRTARALFYWHALRHGYDIFEFMPISERIRAGSTRYPEAYLDTEQEGGDLTHFVLYKLDIVEQSLDRLIEHIRKEQQRLARAQSLLRGVTNLNLRQRILLEHALRHPTQVYTVKSHANSNDIGIVTSRTDLDALVKRKLLTTTKLGKEVQYHPAPGLEAKLLGRKRTPSRRA